MDTDVLIVGAGTAGAAAARACARHGLRVVVVDRNRLEDAGARWVNGVPGWAFDEAGIDRPEGDELVGGDGPFHVLAGWGPERTTIPSSGVLEVNMKRLVARLQQDAWDLGVDLRGEMAVRGWREEGEGAVVETDQGAVSARVVVDASGMAGARLLGQEPPRRELLCTAAQQVHDIEDLQAARAWIREHGVTDGEVLAFTGIAGGYSLINVQVHSHGDDPHVAVLTGSIPALGHPSGQQLLDQFLTEHPWIGAMRLGGARAIPIDVPRSRIGRGPVALLGDAAGQVFAAHGSGIGIQLVTAELLARTLADGGTPFDYARVWHQSWGGRLAAAALFAAFSAQVSEEEMLRVTRSGVMTPSIVGAALAQRDPVPAVAELVSMARGAWRVRDVVRRMLPVFARMGRIQAHHGRYPRAPSELAAWEAKQEKILGYRPAR